MQSEITAPTPYVFSSLDARYDVELRLHREVGSKIGKISRRDEKGERVSLARRPVNDRRLHGWVAVGWS